MAEPIFFAAFTAAMLVGLGVAIGMMIGTDLFLRHEKELEPRALNLTHTYVRKSLAIRLAERRLNNRPVRKNG